MSRRQDILDMFDGKIPEKVPFMLDLSHWFYHKNRLPWDLSKCYDLPEYALIDYHKKHNIGFYLPNLGSFFQVEYPSNIQNRVWKNSNGHEIFWEITTPHGTIRRSRVWEEQNYAWGIAEWAISECEDLYILADSLKDRKFVPLFDKYAKWVDYVGDHGVVYFPAGYSAIGQIMNYWMGVENTVFATFDHPEIMREIVDSINDNNLRLIDLIAESPAEIVLLGDNFSSDIQPPDFFEKWSKPYYEQAIKKLHQAGKYVAIHIDGKIRGAAKMFAAIDADCADAVTPKPTGDLTMLQCREDAGNKMILSGGVAPGLWLPGVSDAQFIEAVHDCLNCAKVNKRLIANAGDQVPPYAEEHKIILMRDIVDNFNF